MANKAVQELDQLGALPDRREISVLYRGSAIAARMACVAEEVEVRVAAYIRGLAVRVKKLEALACEDELVSDAAEVPDTRDVNPVILVETAAARALFNKLVGAAGCSDAASYRATTRQQQSKLTVRPNTTIHMHRQTPS